MSKSLLAGGTHKNQCEFAGPDLQFIENFHFTSITPFAPSSQETEVILSILQLRKLKSRAEDQGQGHGKEVS